MGESQYKRCGVVFNMKNPAHAELYHWCCSQTSNFSDFARSILFHYMRHGASSIAAVGSSAFVSRSEGGSMNLPLESAAPVVEEVESDSTPHRGYSDAESMASMF